MSSGWLYVGVPALAVFVFRAIRKILKDRHDPKATGDPLRHAERRVK